MTQCSICLETTKDPFQSKCYHTFCNKCIMQWITQHDDCPLCRNPISDTPTINSYDDEEESEPIYIIDINDTTLSTEEKKEVDDRLNDFIETLDESFAVYKWKESNEGSWHTSIKKQKYIIDMKIYINATHLDNYYKIWVQLHKRAFVKPKDFKYKKKQFKLNTFKKSTYLYK
jgi:hypothetical protein